MNDPENIIATVVCLDKKIAIDMELPAKLYIRDLSLKILEVLKKVYVGLFSDWEKCSLIYDNWSLSDNDTLITAGIYDGGYIYVAKS